MTRVRGRCQTWSSALFLFLILAALGIILLVIGLTTFLWLPLLIIGGIGLLWLPVIGWLRGADIGWRLAPRSRRRPVDVRCVVRPVQDPGEQSHG